MTISTRSLSFEDVQASQSLEDSNQHIDQSYIDQIEARFDELTDLLAQDVDFGYRSDLGHKDQTESDAHSTIVQTGTESTTLPLELSIVMPCLNEAETVGTCIIKAQYALEKLGVSGEVIVADNGSTDGSVEIARELGARVIHATEKGYGAALMAGIQAAAGKYILMADADDSYDFKQAHRFYKKLCQGHELVQGCRLPSGGGRVMPGAMPMLHKFGNPALTWLVQKMFHAPIHDVYCGMRGFTKELYERLDQRCTGMEFATEMIIKSTMVNASIAEVPIVLYPDGRRSHRPHLRTFHDGWRTLRFFLLQSPRWTFLAPGLVALACGLLGYLMVLAPLQLASITFDAHTLLVSTLSILVGAQCIACGVLAKTFAITEGLLPADYRLEQLVSKATLERTLIGSIALIVAGSTAVAYQTTSWAAGGFGPLDYSETMRGVIPACGAIALGFQMATNSFLLSVLRLARR